MKTTINLIDTEGKLHEVKLTAKDMLNIQTKESKRTFALGAASTALSITSMLLPKTSILKYITLGVGIGGTVLTMISNLDAADNCTSEENLTHIIEELRKIAEREGFVYAC